MSKEKSIEIPRYAIPKYLEEPLLRSLTQTTPGHRFLLYFHGASYKARLSGENVKGKSKDIEQKLNNGEWRKLYKQYQSDDWGPLKDSKLYALNSVAAKSELAKAITEALQNRQALLVQKFSEKVESISLKLTAPLATGLGNPHPVENGFSFLSPYGIPYLPGSGIKGVVRRAAEELALFDENSDWTIPLVWLLFGFEASSAYLAPSSKLETIKVVKKEAEHWRRVFKEYAENQAESDEILKYWLLAVKSSIPKELQGLIEQPSKFCQQLQSNDKLRKAISWQGFLCFWDAFFTESPVAVDILNPHHKDYYEGKGTPNDAESPKPVFFLVVPPETEFTLYVQMVSRNVGSLPFSNWRELVREAVEYACEWMGFGAKTAVGYGTGDVLFEEKMEEGERLQKEEGQHRMEEEERQKLECFEKLPEFQKRIVKILDLKTDEAIVVNYFKELNEFEGAEQKQIAEAFKKRWEEEGKWSTSKKVSKKQRQKVQKIKEILGEA